MEVAIYNQVKRSLQIPGETKDFESLYFKVRQSECRIYSDREVSFLPEIAGTHVHAGEWTMRKNSAARLISYLQKKKKPIRIMDIGCGNGWLSAAMASVPNVQVIGFDVHRAEIDQARRVFEHKKNLHFVSGNMKTAMLLDLKFDVIVFSASLQYFPSLEKTFKDALSLLAPQGEIHIIDTHFYKAEQIELAELRTKKYYWSLGFPEMSDHYYHHKLSDIQLFNYKILFNPNGCVNKLLKHKHPFYWIVINH